MPIYMDKKALGASLNFTKSDRMSLNFTKPGEKQGFNPQPEPPGDKNAKKFDGPANALNG